MKKRLFILLCMFCTLSMVSCVRQTDNDIIERATVETALTNMQDVNNYRMEFLCSFQIDKEEEELKVTVLVTEDKVKFSLTIMDMDIVLYAYEKEGVTYFVFNPAMFNSGALSQWVEISQEELGEYIKPEDVMPLPPVEDPTQLEKLQELVEFFGDIKDEYFDLGKDGYYTLNQTKCDEVETLIKEALLDVPDEVNVDLTTELKIKTNKEYITNAKIKVRLEEEENFAEFLMVFNIDKFNDTKVTLPSQRMSLEEYLASQQGGGAQTDFPSVE